MKKKAIKLSTVILYGMAAAIWILVCALDIAHGTQGFWSVLRILCAIIWSAAFIKVLYKYRKSNHEQ
ncbi:hypothetical protein LJC42_05925 [Eubacteriales bacterium OttesenSCG-928-K08]|nr:hypothetical protein [Eubacteriales bacterium OttesenSCG-928-K08]